MSATEGRAPATGGEPRRIDSPALFRGDREVVIIHQGQEYRLRITRADKLILTK
jgi:hemin uptake protein HemP